MELFLIINVMNIEKGHIILKKNHLTTENAKRYIPNYIIKKKLYP
jgi:hypothetical protein